MTNGERFVSYGQLWRYHGISATCSAFKLKDAYYIMNYSIASFDSDFFLEMNIPRSYTCHY